MNSIESRQARLGSGPQVSVSGTGQGPYRALWQTFRRSVGVTKYVSGAPIWQGSAEEQNYFAPKRDQYQ